MRLGEIITQYCTDHGLSYRQFALQSGVTNGYISMLVNGANPKTGKPLRPTVETYEKLARGMGMSLNNLFEVMDDAPVSLSAPSTRPIGENQRIIFVKNLNRYMKIRDVDQADIVNALDISPSTVSDWATGKKYPRVDSMQRLADFLGVLLSDLTVESDSQNTPFTALENELLTIFRGLNDDGQSALLRQARYLNSDPDMKRGSESSAETA